MIIVVTLLKHFWRNTIAYYSKLSFSYISYLSFLIQFFLTKISNKYFARNKTLLKILHGIKIMQHISLLLLLLLFLRGGVFISIHNTSFIFSWRIFLFNHLEMIIQGLSSTGSGDWAPSQEYALIYIKVNISILVSREISESLLPHPRFSFWLWPCI